MLSIFLKALSYLYFHVDLIDFHFVSIPRTASYVACFSTVENNYVTKLHLLGSISRVTKQG